MKKSINHPTEKGFGLIEAMISILVISGGAILMSNLMMSSAKNSSYAARFDEANDLAQNQLQSLLNYEQIDAKTNTLTYSSIASGSANQTVNSTLYTQVWTVTPITNPTYKNISITVSWDGQSGNTESVTLLESIAPIEPAWQGITFLVPPEPLDPSNSFSP